MFQRGRHTLTIKETHSRAPYNHGIAQIQPLSEEQTIHLVCQLLRLPPAGCHLDLQRPPSLESGMGFHESPPLPPQPQTLANQDFTCFVCPPELIAEGEGTTFHVLVFPGRGLTTYFPSC